MLVNKHNTIKLENKCKSKNRDVFYTRLNKSDLEKYIIEKSNKLTYKKMGNKEEILKGKTHLSLIKGEQKLVIVYDDVINSMQEYSNQQNKQLLDKNNQLGELYSNTDVELQSYKKSSKDWCDKAMLKHNQFLEYKRESEKKISELLARVDELEKANVKHVELLKYIRDNPKTWKSGGAGGQDQYAGLPPMLRYIDEIIDQLTSKY